MLFRSCSNQIKNKLILSVLYTNIKLIRVFNKGIILFNSISVIKYTLRAYQIIIIIGKEQLITYIYIL